MQILIDCTNYRALARHENWGALGALAYIQFANVDTAVVPLDENKYLACFTMEQLQSIHAALRPKEKFEHHTYQAALRAVRELLLTDPSLVLPFKPAELEAQAHCIEADDSRPYDFVPGATKPKRAKSWVVAPQRDRPRNAPGTSDQHRPKGQPSARAASEAPPPAPAPVATPAPAGGRGRGKAAPAAPAPAASKPPRAKPVRTQGGPPREERNGQRVPAPGTVGGKLWEIFTKLTAKNALTMENALRDGKAQGINENSVKACMSHWRRFHK